jgi:orotidine-5'-phosphate decarboxylase
MSHGALSSFEGALGVTPGVRYNRADAQQKQSRAEATQKQSSSNSGTTITGDQSGESDDTSFFTSFTFWVQRF